MELPAFPVPVVLEFWRHGEVNSLADTGGDDQARRHSEDTKLIFEMKVLTRNHPVVAPDAYLMSPTLRAQELVLMHMKSAKAQNVPLRELCEFYYPPGDFGRQLREINKAFAAPGLTLGRLLADAEAGRVYRYYGGEGAKTALLCAEAFLETRTTADAQRPLRIVIAGHDMCQQSFVWALIEHRVPLTDELMVLNTSLDFFDHLAVTLTPVGRKTHAVNVEVKHVPFPTD